MEIPKITDEERRDRSFQLGYIKGCLEALRPTLDAIALVPERPSWERVRVRLTLPGSAAWNAKRLLEFLDEIPKIPNQ